MKGLILFLLLSGTSIAYAQQKVVNKPEYVIIINNEIVSKNKVDEYAKLGYIKSITKGVTEAQRIELAKQVGEQVGSKEFIILISLYTEAEKKEREKEAGTLAVTKDSVQQKDEFFLHVNEAAKDFSVQMLDGSVWQLSQLKGKVVLINFWATWCAPCLMEFYDFPTKILAPFKDSSFVLIPISIGETKEKVNQKMQSLKKDGIDFNVGTDEKETIFSLFAEGAIPKNFLIDQKGIIRYTSTGYSEDNIEKLAQEIKKLLSQ